MILRSLQDLLVYELEDLYDAESQIIESLPGLIHAAQSPVLKRSLRMHLEETKAQAERLEQIFTELDIDIVGKECLGLEGIVQEAEEMIQVNISSPVTDAAIIASAQRIEHYEIAAYGCAITYAELLGFASVVDLLKQTMDEEEGSDQKLSELAESLINPEAAKTAFDKV